MTTVTALHNIIRCLLRTPADSSTLADQACRTDTSRKPAKTQTEGTPKRHKTRSSPACGTKNDSWLRGCT
jgi:hypothetical protein